MIATIQPPADATAVIVIAECYAVHTPDNADYEVWVAPERPAQKRRRAIVRFPFAHSPQSAAVEMYRDADRTAVKVGISLEVARFVAKCHVEWSYPDTDGAIVVFASH